MDSCSYGNYRVELAFRIASQYLIDLSPRERLRKAGVLSGNFWLTR